MQLFKEVLAFWKAICKHWWPLMSCAAFTLLGLYALITKKNNTWMIYATFGLAIIFFLWSAFLAWRGEHNSRLKIEKDLASGYKGRPILVLKVYALTGHDQPRKWTLYLENCGTRVARFVRMEPTSSNSGKFTLWFNELPVLKSGCEENVGYWITQGLANNNASLTDFLRDHSKDAALIWWDIKITFRDMDDSVQQETVRLCYEVQTDVLHTRAVPYTGKNWK